jgi:hypothetical protein
VVIGDGGDFVSFAGKYIEPECPSGWLDSGPFGCLGTGLGYAIAARLPVNELWHGTPSIVRHTAQDRITPYRMMTRSQTTTLIARMTQPCHGARAGRSQPGRHGRAFRAAGPRVAAPHEPPVHRA